MDPAIFILLLFLGHSSRAQDRAEASGTIFLRLPFNPYFNINPKSCCKFYQGSCVLFVDNRGYCADLYKGRLSITQYNGLMLVKIWNLQKSDAGVYRCFVVESPYHIYMDYIIQLSDSTNQQSPPLPSLTSTTRPTMVATVTTSATTMASLDETQSDGSSRFKTDMWIPLAVALGMLAILILITSLIAVTFHRRRKDEKKSGTSSCDKHSSINISGSTSQDVNGIVYTTVNFDTGAQPAKLYANLEVHRSPATGCPQTYGRQDSRDDVEYSTVAFRQK